MISGGEIQNATEALLRLDEDGAFSASEFGPPHQRPCRSQGGSGGLSGRRGRGNTQERVGHIMRYDVNDDGKVSRDELPGPMRGILERADTNGDNAVNRQELLQLAEQSGGRRRHGQPRGIGKDNVERPSRPE